MISTKLTAGGGCDSSINNNTNKYTSDIAYTEGYSDGYRDAYICFSNDILEKKFSVYSLKNNFSNSIKKNEYEIVISNNKDYIFRIFILFIINKENNELTFKVTSSTIYFDNITLEDEPIIKSDILEVIDYLDKVIQDYINS